MLLSEPGSIRLVDVKDVFADRIENEVVYSEQVLEPIGDVHRVLETRPSIDIRIDEEMRVCVYWLDQGTLVTLEILNVGVALPNVRSLSILHGLVNTLIWMRKFPQGSE